MRVLVTGAAGFIGSHVVRALLGRGHDVHAVIRPAHPAPRLRELRDDLAVWEVDLLDEAAVRRAVHGAGADAAIHLAWYTEPGRYLNDRPQNLASTGASAALFRHLLEGHCERLVLGGTCLEAATASGDTPTFYAVAKRLVHELAMQLGDEGPSVACAHVFSVYGPGENEKRAIPSITRSLLQNRAVDVTDGSQLRDYVHVADVAEGLCTVLESGCVGAVDICSGSPLPMRRVLENLGEAAGRPNLLQWGALSTTPGEDFEVTGDPGPLHALGWRPRYSLAEGLRDTVAWWDAQAANVVAGTEER